MEASCGGVGLVSVEVAQLVGHCRGQSGLTDSLAPGMNTTPVTIMASGLDLPTGSLFYCSSLACD